MSNRKVPGPIQKQYNNKRNGNKHPAETRTLPGETKSKTNSTTPARRSRKRIGKTDKNRTPGKSKTRGRRLFCFSGSNHRKKR